MSGNSIEELRQPRMSPHQHSIINTEIDFDERKSNFEDAWISVDAMILLGVVYCGGFDSEKAKVFHRVVAPEYDSIVTITDKDLNTALRFMVTTATICEEMTRKIIEDPTAEVDYKYYARKIKRYEPTF